MPVDRSRRLIGSACHFVWRLFFKGLQSFKRKAERLLGPVA